MMSKQFTGRTGFARPFVTCLLACVCTRPDVAQASAPVGEWTVIGLVDGADAVEAPNNGAGEEALLTIDKKSPYQAGQALQVFKSFDATAWRGKRIHVRYSLSTALAADIRPSDNILPQVGVRIQCDKVFKTNLHTTGKGLTKFPELIMNFEVPNDAMVCGFGFFLAKPMRMALKGLKFGEGFIAPPTPTFTLEGKQLFPFPKPGTVLPELELGKPGVP